MTGWVDPDDPVLSAVTSLAAELADPVRLTALQLLAAEGPHTMSQLAEALGVAAPRLGNHLARLRGAGLVLVEHTGRHAVYQLADPHLGDVLAALSGYACAGDRVERPGRPLVPADIAHTCYDHVAGRLGVALFASLAGRGAIARPDGRGDEVTVKPEAPALAELGVDIRTIASGNNRRKLATACLDRTHRLPHLGGALGAAVLDSLIARRLLRRVDNDRTLVLTGRGRELLPGLIPGFTLL